MPARRIGEALRAQFLLEGTLRALSRVENVLPVTVAAAAEFDRLREHKNPKKIGRDDLLIAAIVLTHRATLVTRNVKDFRHIPDLSIENWAD